MRKKLLAALLSVCIIVSMMVVPASASAFNDVSSDHWAASAIERWAGYEVLNGNGDGTFAPDRQMTRAEFASMLVNMLGLTKKSSTKFPDVPDNAWYADCISIAAAAGIITGDNGNAAPSRAISFNEAAVMLCRALGLAKTNVSGADWAKESIEKLTEMGAIGGSDTHLQAGADCNRAVVAALADKIVEQYVDEDTTITGQVKGVVLVVKGAKADIKDAVLSAPLVIESAEATLTNTTAQDVKVDGANSAVSTDAKSAVAEVILGGEAPKADIKGTATSVTVAENATSAVVDAPASVEVKNESTSAITVNGETQEPTKTDDTNTTTTPEVTEGTSTAAHTHQWAYKQTAEMKHIKYCTICKQGDDSTPVSCEPSYTYVGVDNQTHKAVCSLCGAVADPSAHTLVNGSCTSCDYKQTISAGNSAVDAEHTHEWVLNTDDPRYVAPTCTTAGVGVYRCTNTVTIPAETPDEGQQPEVTGQADATENCTATMTATLPATGHTYNLEGAPSSKKDSTCTEAGYEIYTCTVCHGAPKNVPLETKPHEAVTVTDENRATVYVKTPTQHALPCKNCGTTMTMTNHNWGDDNVCDDCGYECKHPTTTATQIQDNETQHKVVCATCGKVITETENHSFTTLKTAEVPATCAAAGTKAVYECACGKTSGGDEIPKTQDHDWGKWTTAEGGANCTRTCSVCKETETTTHTDLTSCDKCGWTKTETTN